MAISVTISDRKVAGDEREHRGTLNLGTSYTTGGVAYTAGSFGLATIEELRIEQIAVASGVARIFTIDRANKKIQAWETITAATLAIVEVDATDDLSTYVVQWTAKGR